MTVKKSLSHLEQYYAKAMSKRYGKRRNIFIQSTISYDKQLYKKYIRMFYMDAIWTEKLRNSI